MEAYFIISKKDCKIIGNQLGYKSYGLALNDAYNLIGSKCQYYLTIEELSNYEKLYYDKCDNGSIKYKYNDSKWRKFIGDPYIEQNYSIIKRKFKIEFTDGF